MNQQLQQGTPEWIAARLGKATASRIGDLVAKTKSGPAASRANYLSQLVTEVLTGEAIPFFVTTAMQWGIDKEGDARARYEAVNFVEVQQVGMYDHPFIAKSGASPDGLVSTDGLIEIKCPNTQTHIDTLIANKAPAKYVAQMQWQMACTGRIWCDFVSYDPRLPVRHQFAQFRVLRDQILINSYEEEVRKFLAELDQTILTLNSRK